MVRMCIKTPDDAGDLCEWTIIELQGDLENRDGSHLAGKFIGDLHYTDKDTPMMIIGHHILHGKVIKLDKPFAVVKTVRSKETMETDYALESASRTTNYHVTALITKKILFKTRPKPIIANVPKKV